MKPSYTPTMQAQNRLVLFCDWKDILDVIVLNVVSATDKILWNDPRMANNRVKGLPYHTSFQSSDKALIDSYKDIRKN